MNSKKQLNSDQDVYRQQWRWPAIIVSRKIVAENTLELQLTIADPTFSYQPGQYIWLVLPKLQFDDPRGSRRAFSIINAPTANGLVTLLFREEDSGYHRTLHELPLKSSVECLGPFGHAFIIPRRSPDLVLIAGGLGVAPFLSLVRSATSMNGPRLTLLWYNDSERRTPYLDELRRLTKANRKITIRHYTRTFAFSDVGPKEQRNRWYVCGPQGLIDAVAQAAKEHGIGRRQIRFEQHYPQLPGAQDLAKQLADIRLHSGNSHKKQAAAPNTDINSRVLPTAFLAGGLISALVGVVYLMNGQPATINLLMAVFLLVIRVVWRWPPSRPAINKLTLIVIFGVMALVAASGGSENSGILWVGIFPLIALWLQPRTGLWWAASFIAVIFGYSLTDALGLYRLAYSGEVYFQVGMFLILISAITSIFLRGNFWLQQQLTATINEERIFHQAIDSSTNHIIITDANANILYANAAAQRITGYSFTEMFGYTPRLWGGLMSDKFYQQLWSTSLSGRPVISEVTNHRKNHEVYTAIAHISPILHPRYGITGYVATEEDISLEKKNEAHLADLTKRFELATSSAKIGIWDWDVINDVVLWDDQMCALYGIQKSDFKGVYRAWQKSIYPADQKGNDDAIQQALQGRKDFDATFRVLWSNGEIHWLRAFGDVERDGTGRPVKMVGVNWDITKEKEVDQAKTEFVSLASHQLRTPLTAINWYAEMLLAGDAGPLTTAQRGFAQEVMAGSKRMTTLVNTLLNVARIEAGTFSIMPEKVAIQEIIAIVLKENQSRIQEQRHTVKQEIDAKQPAVSVDRQLMYIIIENLITNAIKYTPPQGTITVGYNRQGKNLALSVTDTGYGIPRNQQKRVFEKLFRADNIRSKVVDGDGLGMYIVKSILDHTGGTITLTSTEGEGTEFIVTLPSTGMIARSGTKTLTP